LRRDEKWTPIHLQRLHEFVNLCQHLLIEATAGVSDVMKAAATIQSNHERAKVRPRSARLRVAANHHFRPLHGFYLQPVRTTFLNVMTGSAFSDHSFEMKFLDLFKELFTIAHDVIR